LVVPLATTLNNLLGQNRSTAFKVGGNGIISANSFYASGTGTTTETIASASFEGAASTKRTTEIAATVLGGPAPVVMSLTWQQFFDFNYKPVGSMHNGIYCVTTSYIQPPAAVGMWKTSMWFTEDCFSGPDKLKKLGVAGTAYTISAETASTARLWIGRKLSLTDGSELRSETTYSIDTLGNSSPRFSNFSPFSVGAATINLIPLYLY
jgi:hypothetical protein